MTVFATVAALAYLLGSIPFGYLLVRVFRKEDIRAFGSGNIGATNVARRAPLWGAATLLLDAAKGWLAVELATQLSGRMWAQGEEFYANFFRVRALAALLAVAGHMFPLWLGFRGGKGVATGAGAFLALAPSVMAPALGVFAVVVAVSRYVSLGSMAAAAALPAAYYLRHSPHTQPEVLASLGAVAILVIAKHHGNIRRLYAGTEQRLSFTLRAED
ncbi:MAG: glycerol-3-phosphate 1-O-acyltransferase PlsY [Terriglobales bacterium]